ncbi:MAG: DUF934 domain-containing protein [Alphaproteobacteria bacterium]
MPLIKDGAFITDSFTRVADADELPAGAVIVSLSRFLDAREALLSRDAPLGVRIGSHETPDALGPDVHRLAVVELSFPKFRDGRGYSSARVLRDRLGYRGEVRAVGEVLRDQWLFMRRCGVDACEVREGTGLEDFRAALGEQTVFYQRTADGVPDIFALRQRQRQSTALAAE